MPDAFNLNTKQSSYDGNVVVIDGNRYAMRGSTRGGTQKMLQAEANMKTVQAEMGDSTMPTAEQADVLVTSMLTVISARLRPLDGAPDAGAYLGERWQADEVELEQLEELVDLIGQKAADIQKAAALPPA